MNSTVLYNTTAPMWRKFPASRNPVESSYNSPPFSRTVNTLEYEFSYDARAQPFAEFSMGHEAFGLWFTFELSNHVQRIEALLRSVDQLERHSIFEDDIIGVEHKLTLTRDSVEISPLHESIDELPEDTDLTEDGSHAHCGLLDFKQALLSWQAFVSERM